MLPLNRFCVPLALGLSLSPFTFAAQQQLSDNAIRIGFITDMSGVYADADGSGGATAIDMAIADFQIGNPGWKIEFFKADHQNKPDLASAKAREWFDQNHLDMLIGGTNSAASIAMKNIAASKKKPFFAIGSGASSLTNEECSAYTIHYAYDTYALAKSTGSAVVKAGGKSWYFLTADYKFGKDLQSDTAAVVKANGGSVLGEVRHPLNASDFSSFVLQAQSSGAQILGLANASGDTVNAIKAANEFGLTKNMKLAGMLLFITDVHSLGLNLAQGMYLSTAWTWDQSAESRTWAKRYFDKVKRMPTMVQAADYSATMQYLNAVKAAGSDDGDAVMTQLHKTHIHDMFTSDGSIRTDGRMVHSMKLVQVKTPQQSKGEWDLYNLIADIPADQAFRPLSESKCPLLRK
jgi:branched-chain amino acid transport system substrate-binding protein